MSRRVALLSSGSRFTAELLAVLHERDMPVDALVVYTPPPPRRPLPFARWLGRRLLRPPRTRFTVGFMELVETGPLNGWRMTRDLAQFRPDVLLLAHCGLLQPALLAIPADGVVNVHPGLLPWIRGNSPFGNSLLRGIPLGSTSFRVDAGIDTGPILERRLMPVEGSETVQELRARLREIWVEMTVDLLAAARSGELGPGHRQNEKAPLCRTLAAPAELRAVDAAVRAGTPQALFEAWRPRCDSRLRLATHDDGTVGNDGR